MSKKQEKREIASETKHAMHDQSRGVKLEALDPDFLNSYQKDLNNYLQDLVLKALASRRELFVHELAARLGAALGSNGGTASGPDQAAAQGASSDWIEIESMSSLRALVGGRFQNLKEKWIKAGFPLREHRGDRENTFEVDQTAWIDLANWISKQGYEVRLSSNKPNCLFELKKIN